MTFIAYFFLFVLILSVSELYVLIQVCSVIAFPLTLGLCVLTGIIGGAMVRHQGLQTLRRLRGELASGRLPADEILEGLVLIIIGALLCVPGFITDVFGFLMLIPLLRKKSVQWLKKRFAGKFTITHSYFGPGAPFMKKERDVIDVDYEEKTPEK